MEYLLKDDVNEVLVHNEGDTLVVQTWEKCPQYTSTLLYCAKKFATEAHTKIKLLCIAPSIANKMTQEMIKMRLGATEVGENNIDFKHDSQPKTLDKDNPVCIEFKL